jgi:hypothetical protein
VPAKSLLWQQHNSKSMVIPSDPRNTLTPELKARLLAFLKTQSFSLEEQAGDATDNDAARMLLEQVQSDVQVLADRASALEAQSILVAVQSLDFLAQGMAWMCSISAYALYGGLVWWILPDVESCVASQMALLLPTTPTHVSTILPVLVSWIFRLTILALPFLYNRRTHGSLHRRFEVFAVAFLMIARVRLCRWREKDFGSKDSDTDDDDKKVTRLGESLSSEALWEIHYEVSARFLYCRIRRLRGLWTKTAQYLSSRADFMPRGYVRELSCLQDEAPATPWDQVVGTLPAAIRQQLTEIDETPLASASIGQVHTARSIKTGEKVVIKVHHPHARTLLLDNFVSLAIILRVVAWMEPDYEFLEILMRLKRKI